MQSQSSRAPRRKGPLVVRDLTAAYAGHRAARPNRPPPLRHPGAEALLSGERDSAPQRPGRAALPPEWVDVAERAREELKEIQSQLVHLTKAQQRRLLREQSPKEGPDKEVEVLSSSIAMLVRCCEQSIHQVRTCGVSREAGGATLLNDEFRENVQRSLAAELSQLSKQCRESQKAYLTEVRRRQQDASQVAAQGSGRPNEAAAEGGRLASQHAMELDSMEEKAAQRSSEIAQIASSVSELHSIFKELATLVIEQGTILDRIDYNTEKIYKKSDDAMGQMNKAVKRKAGNDDRVLKCLIFWVGGDVLLFLVLLVKLHVKYGLKNVLILLLVIGAIVGGVLLARKLRPQWIPQEADLERALPADLDPASLWRRFRPGPWQAAKAAGSAASAANSMRPL